jgi:hypothetical protein
MQPVPPVPREVLERIAQAIRGVRFGSVQIVIHESRVVQIERAEKIRLDSSPTCPQEACRRLSSESTG